MINSLQLECLTPLNIVDWIETNVTQGQAALLLATVAQKLYFTFKDYHIKSMGSTTKINKIESPLSSITTPQALYLKFTPLNLFSSSDLLLDYMLLQHYLNASMLTFLKCIHQVSEFIKIISSASNSLVNNAAGSVSSTKSGRKGQRES